jgi:alkanesulfonate monooxygenase SsuD/methylene tetrahydromethanopterin reductase-like flavin-dependent oxidoreductase (luciferase family)
VEFHLFVPQVGITFPDLVLRARTAEAVGFSGIALIDHLGAAGGGRRGSLDAMVSATWLAAHTERLTIGHLVLCDAVRHPALLAKQVVALDHCSHGRFELGLGWGSDQRELDTFGFGAADASDRISRLGESIDVMRLLWSGERVHFEGRFHRLHDVVGDPVPTRKIPIIIGGAGRQTLELVASVADWWNCPATHLHHLTQYLPRIGTARVSVHQPVVLIPSGAQPDAASGALRYFERLVGEDVVIAGDVDQVVRSFRQLDDLGVERVYVWSADDQLAVFGDVIADV